MKGRFLGWLRWLGGMGGVFLGLALALFRGLPQAASAPALPLPEGLFEARGDYVTGSSAPDAAELAWLARFRVVHAGGLGDPLPPETMAALRRAGVETLLAYDWLPATYHFTDGEADDPLTQWLYANREWATLNPQGPFPHCAEEGYDWCEDYYFDLGHPQVRARRVAYLRQWVSDHGYDGLFFDWGNSLFLEEEPFTAIRDTYRARHPDLPYAQAAALFLQALREAGIVVQTNQGYRDAQDLLPQVHYDLAESYGVSDSEPVRRLCLQGEGVTEVPLTVYYPVSEDPYQGTLEDTLEVMAWVEDLQAAYAGPEYRGFVYLNYAAPRWAPLPGASSRWGKRIVRAPWSVCPDGQGPYVATRPRPAIFYAFALAKLVGQMAYTEVPWAHRLERDPVYFANLGTPVEEDYRPLPQGGYVRYYTEGLVLVGAWQRATVVRLTHPSLPAGGLVYDAYRRKWLRTGNHTLRLPVIPEEDPYTGRPAPSGRVVLYPRRAP